LNSISQGNRRSEQELFLITVSSKQKDRILLGCIAGYVIYALLNILAMVFYPGGTSIDRDRIAYSFFENFFSDLGMARTYSGEPNTLSRLLFTSALILVGIVLIAFFLLLVSYFNETKLEMNSSRIGSAAGILAGIACIGIATTPWDLYLNIHMIFVFALSFALLVVLISYSIAILSNKPYPNLYAWVFMFYAFILAIYIVLMRVSPDIETASGLRIMATGQKILIYSGMLCLFVQVLGAFFYNKRDDFRQAA
jgi:magnesium-transporting ATPase (P-type)